MPMYMGENGPHLALTDPEVAPPSYCFFRKEKIERKEGGRKSREGGRGKKREKEGGSRERESGGRKGGRVEGREGGRERGREGGREGEVQLEQEHEGRKVGMGDTVQVHLN